MAAGVFAHSAHILHFAEFHTDVFIGLVKTYEEMFL